MIKGKIFLFFLMLFGLSIIGQAQQSININTVSSNQYGQVALPNTAPFNSLGGFQIVWRVREVDGTGGRNYATLFQLTNGFETIPNIASPSRIDASFPVRSGDTHDGAIYMTPTDITDIVCKLQFDPANSRWTYETWKSDGTGYTSATKTIQNTSNFNLSGETLTIGASYWGVIGQRMAKAKLNYWRWIQRVETLGIFPTETAPTGVTYLAKYEFEGNVNDTSGNGLNLSWFGDAPTYEGAAATGTVKLYPTTLRITKGKSNTATAIYKNSSGVQQSAPFTFTSNNTGIVTVGNDIKEVGTSNNLASIKAINAGTTTVTGTYNGLTTNPVTITVDDPAAAPNAVMSGDSNGTTAITAKVGEPIEVSAESSTGVNTVEWNWGDPDKTTDTLSATHSYFQAGTYTLSLTVKNTSGVESTKIVTVNIQNFSAPTATYTVTTAQQLVDAYNLCNGGEEIVIPAGTIITGHIELPSRSFSDYVTIRSSGTMPNVWDRITPNSSQLATIKGQFVNVPTLRIRNGASKLRFIGINFQPFEQTTTDQFSLVEVGDLGQSSYTTNPSKIIFQHIVMNPPDTTMVRHGMAVEGYKIAVISSWIGNIFTRCFQGSGCVTDSNAFFSLNGKGAHVYLNSYIEASSENILYGGDNVSVDGGIPTNVEIRRCYFFKRTAWKPNPTPLYNIKNLIEFKIGRRVYLEGNIFENHWLGADAGQPNAINISAISEVNSPWSVNEDIIFENNKVINMPSGVLLANANGTNVSDYDTRKSINIKFKNMLFDKFNEVDYQRRLFITNGVEDASFDRITQIDTNLATGRLAFIARPSDYRINLTNSIVGMGTDYQIFSSYGWGRCALNWGTGGTGNADPCTPNGQWNVSNNIFVRYNTNPLITPPANNCDAAVGFNAVGFLDLAGGNYRLTGSGACYQGQTNIGADIATLDLRTFCTASGLATGCATGTQTPYSARASNLTLATQIEVENFDNGGQGVAYNDTTVNPTRSSAYRSSPIENVSIQARATASNGFAVFEASAGEWLEYTVNVPSTGNYLFSVRYASEFVNGKFHLEVCNANGTGVTNCVSSPQLTALSTGNWGAFAEVTTTMSLTAGNGKILRLVLDTNSPDGCGCIVANFDRITASELILPTAPSNLVGTVLSTTSVKLDWTDNSSNEGTFLVQRCTGSACTNYTTVAGGGVAPNTITFTDTGVPAGTINRYRIGAINGAGATYSNVITITVAVPTAPTGLTAAAAAGRLANLSWSSSANNVTNFQVQRCTGTTATCTSTSTNWTNVSTTVSRTATTYQDSGLTAGTAYRYRIRAVNGAGNSAYALTTSTITALP